MIVLVFPLESVSVLSYYLWKGILSQKLLTITNRLPHNPTTISCYGFYETIGREMGHSAAVSTASWVKTSIIWIIFIFENIKAENQECSDLKSFHGLLAGLLGDSCHLELLKGGGQDAWTLFLGPPTSHRQGVVYFCTWKVAWIRTPLGAWKCNLPPF